LHHRRNSKRNFEEKYGEKETCEKRGNVVLMGAKWHINPQSSVM
jgi:hypothetical protein